MVRRCQEGPEIDLTKMDLMLDQEVDPDRCQDQAVLVADQAQCLKVEWDPEDVQDLCPAPAVQVVDLVQCLDLLLMVRTALVADHNLALTALEADLVLVLLAVKTVLPA